MNQCRLIMLLGLFVYNVNGRLNSMVEEEEENSKEPNSNLEAFEFEFSEDDQVEDDQVEDHEVLKRQSTDQFRQRALQSHNEYRARHGCPPLTLDDKLNREAEAYAMEETRTNVQKHSCGPCDKYGENLAYTAGTQQQPRDAAAADWACKAWYDEIKLYNFQNPNLGSSGSWGHLTALLWKSTTKMGIGVAYGTKTSLSGNKMNTVYVVARYFPPGNVWDANILRANVPPPRF